MDKQIKQIKRLCGKLRKKEPLSQCDYRKLQELRWRRVRFLLALQRQISVEMMAKHAIGRAQSYVKVIVVNLYIGIELERNRKIRKKFMDWNSERIIFVSSTFFLYC